MKNIILLLFGLLLVVSCQNPQSSDEAKFDIKAVENFISEANKSYSKRFITNKAAFYAERYCKDAIVFPVERARVIGRDSIAKYYFTGGENTEIAMNITTTDLYGDKNMIVEEGNYDFPDGKGGSFDKGKFIALWKPEEGKWKLFREIWNTDITPKK